MASANDMKAAEKTYESFITMVKWTTPALAILTMIIILLIAN